MNIHTLFSGIDAELLKDFDGTTTHTYDLTQSAWFCETDEKWGGFSNMACIDKATKGKRYPLRVNGESIRCSEHLYQALRYTHLEDRQAEILDEASPMSAKMKAKHNRDTETRPDFDQISDGLMWWTLRVKLACNPVKFAALLRESKDLPIVEVSSKKSPRPSDLHWGAVRSKTQPNQVTGCNVLGRQLMILRTLVTTRPENDWRIVPPPTGIPNFNLLGKSIGTVDYRIR